jgi:hypothetical protein
MNVEQVEAKLIEVLCSIQSDSGYPAEIGSATCPIELEGFDSLIWPVSIGILASELGIDIPGGINIYLSEKENKPLTVRESAQVVWELSEIGE